MARAAVAPIRASGSGRGAGTERARPTSLSGQRTYGSLEPGHVSAHANRGATRGIDDNSQPGGHGHDDTAAQRVLNEQAQSDWCEVVIEDVGGGGRGFSGPSSP